MKLKERILNKDNIIFLLSLFYLSGMILLLVLYFRANLAGLLDSDMASEMVLSRLLANEGRLVTDNWYYSTEIRILSIQLVFTPLFKIISGWRKVRIIGTALLYLFMAGASFLVCKSVKKTKWFPFLDLCILIPLADQYYSFVHRCAIYIPFIVISFTAFSLWFLFVNTKGKKRFIFLVLSFVLAVFSCMGGGRELLVFYLPLLICGAILFGMDFYSKRKIDVHSLYNQLLFASIVSMAGAIAGFLINSKYLVNKYSFVPWDNIELCDFRLDIFLLVIQNYLNSFGFVGGPLDGIRFIKAATAFILLILTVFCIIYGIRNRKKVSEEYFITSVYTLIAFVVFTMFYSFTTMAYTIRYNIPVMIFAFVPLTLYMAHVKQTSGRLNVIVPAISLTVLMTVSGVITLNEYKKDYVDFSVAECLDALSDEGFTAGYSEFWLANKVTELSEGEIEMHCFGGFYSDAEMYYMTSINSPHRWLEEVDLENRRPEGRVMIFLTTGQYDNCLWHDAMADYLVYSSDDYKVFGFDDYTNMLSVIGSYNYAFNGEFLENGMDSEGTRYLYPSGFSFGPYITFYEGTYRVTITGENIQDLSLDCTSFHGEHHFDYVVISDTDTERIIEFTCDCDHYEGEVAVYNSSDSDTVSINRLSIEYVG